MFLEILKQADLSLTDDNACRECQCPHKPKPTKTTKPQTSFTRSSKYSVNGGIWNRSILLINMQVYKYASFFFPQKLLPHIYNSSQSEVYKFVGRDHTGIARGSLRAVKSRAAYIYFDGVRAVA